MMHEPRWGEYSHIYCIILCVMYVNAWPTSHWEAHVTLSLPPEKPEASWLSPTGQSESDIHVASQSESAIYIEAKTMWIQRCIWRLLYGSNTLCSINISRFIRRVGSLCWIFRCQLQTANLFYSYFLMRGLIASFYKWGSATLEKNMICILNIVILI